MKKDLQLVPYLTFDGNCHEAMEFYKTIFGGELAVNYYRDLYPDLAEANKDKIMHSMLDSDRLP